MRERGSVHRLGAIDIARFRTPRTSTVCTTAPLATATRDYSYHQGRLLPATGFEPPPTATATGATQTPTCEGHLTSPHHLTNTHITTHHSPLTAATPAMAAAVAVSIARASLRGGLLRPDPTAVAADEIAAFHALLDKALTICSPANIQVATQTLTSPPPPRARARLLPPPLTSKTSSPCPYPHSHSYIKTNAAAAECSPARTE